MKPITLLPLSIFVIGFIQAFSAFKVAAQSRAMDPNSLLRIYSQITDRTVLRPIDLPSVSDSVISQIPSDTNAAVTFIESELAKVGVDMVRDGQWFVRVLPAGWKSSPMAAHLARIPQPRPREEQLDKADELVVTGMGPYEFPFDQFLQLYSDFRERTILHQPTQQVQRVTLRAQTSLTHEEIEYALAVVLALNGLAVVDDGEHLTQIVPLAHFGQVQAHAPKPDAGAERISLDKVPRFQHVDSLVTYYAALSDRKAVPSEKVGQRPVVFGVQTPLTRAELLYAIETTLRLDGLTIVAGETNSVHAERLSDMKLH